MSKDPLQEEKYHIFYEHITPEKRIDVERRRERSTGK